MVVGSGPGSYLGIGFGHAVTLEKSATGAAVIIRGPRGVAPLRLDITVTEAGATVRLRDSILQEPPPSLPTSIPPPLREVSRVDTATSGPSSVLPEPRLSLEQYASLRAACVSAEQEKLTEVRSRYALDEAGDAVESDAWARKFSRDLMLFESYRHLFQAYRSTAAQRDATRK
jgi:hypothetical protein